MPYSPDIAEGTPAKLRSGEWGCRGSVAGSLHFRDLTPGQDMTVQVTTRAGKTWTRWFRCIWVNPDGQFLAAPINENELDAKIAKAAAEAKTAKPVSNPVNSRGVPVSWAAQCAMLDAATAARRKAS